MIDGKNVVGLGAFKSYVSLWFFQGALLTDRDEVLINAQEGKTKALRQWRFTSVDEIITGDVLAYVKEAVNNQKQDKIIRAKKPEKVAIPRELLTLLDTENQIKVAFEKIAPYKQKEYAGYISAAKRASTKESRLKKIAPMILVGKRLNDKYRVVK